MSGEQILEAVSYLAWASGFAILAVGMAAAAISYRRWVGRQQHHGRPVHDH
jgi:hypothetical protein